MVRAPSSLLGGVKDCCTVCSSSDFSRAIVKPKSENFKILAKKRRWYNNGITHVFQENCPVGYIVGSLSNSTKGHILTDEHRKKLGQQSKNRKWYNNGEIEKFSKNEILGWKLGRLLKN